MYGITYHTSLCSNFSSCSRLSKKMDWLFPYSTGGVTDIPFIIGPISSWANFVTGLQLTCWVLKWTYAIQKYLVSFKQSKSGRPSPVQLLIINCVIIIACTPKALSTVHLVCPLHNLELQLLFTEKKESETFPLLLLPGKASFAKMTNPNDKRM